MVQKSETQRQNSSDVRKESASLTTQAQPIHSSNKEKEIRRKKENEEQKHDRKQGT
jgi:hypothetical protein